MKRYGAIRKIMLILLLSILGSYCIGSQDIHESNSFTTIINYTYSMVFSLGSYFYKLYTEITNQFIAILYNKQTQDVLIQKISHSNDNNKCTDDREDCISNEEFFLDTWFTGKLDMDTKSHLDVDAAPMQFVQD